VLAASIIRANGRYENMKSQQGIYWQSECISRLRTRVQDLISVHQLSVRNVDVWFLLYGFSMQLLHINMATVEDVPLAFFFPIRPSAGLGPHLFGQSHSPTFWTRPKMPPNMALPVQPPPLLRAICYPHIGITYFQVGLAEMQDSDFLGNFWRPYSAVRKGNCLLFSVIHPMHSSSADKRGRFSFQMTVLVNVKRWTKPSCVKGKTVGWASWLERSVTY
jgi:hypothetical protein